MKTDSNSAKLNRSSVYIVAELSANHGNKLDIALASVRAAKKCGADAVKVQTYTADTMTLDCDTDVFQIKHGTLWDGTSLYKLFDETHMPWDWHEAMRDEAQKCGVDFFSTPFDRTAVDFLEGLGVEIFKIASCEITDTPLIEYAASKGMPMLISTGVATLEDIEEAVRACRRAGNDDITLLKCTCSYPADPKDINLLTIPDMSARFGVKVGISDHTVGSTVAIASVPLGATVIEKHFVLDRSVESADASFSMTPAEFKLMVDGVRTAELAMGEVSYDLAAESKRNRAFVRSLFIAEEMEEGEVFTEKNLRSVRPGCGLHPRHLREILGRKATKDLKKGLPAEWWMVDRG